MRGTQRNFGGVPLDFSGVPLDSSGVPLDFSGTPLNSSGVPLDSSGVPLNSSGVPLNSSGVPLGFSGAPLGFSGAPLDLRSGLSEPDLNGGDFLLYVVGLTKAFVGLGKAAAFFEKKAVGLLTLFLKFRILVNVCGNWAFR